MGAVASSMSCTIFVTQPHHNPYIVKLHLTSVGNYLIGWKLHLSRVKRQMIEDPELGSVPVGRPPSTSGDPAPEEEEEAETDAVVQASTGLTGSDVLSPCSSRIKLRCKGRLRGKGEEMVATCESIWNGESLRYLQIDLYYCVKC